MIVIIGAGLAGLSTAYHLHSKDYLIFDPNGIVGGVCNTFYQDGFTFDGVGHVMHFKQAYTLELASKLLQGNLHKVRRKSSIYFDGAFVPYPFQMNLFRLPHDVKMECILGAIQARYERSRGDASNFAEWILSSLGEGIAKHFMFPYNEKIWTVHPSEMTTSWLGGFVPEPDLKSILEGAIRDRENGLIGYNAEFWYPVRGGIQVYPEAIEPHVKNLYLQTPVERVDVRRRAVWAGGEWHPYTALVSTAPIVKLIGMIEDGPQEVVRAAARLRANSVYSVLVGVDRPNISDQHWIYFPQKDLIFYRIGIPSNLSPYMAPEGTSSVCAEIAYRGSLGLSEHELIDRTVADLRRAGVLHPEDRVLTARAVHFPIAYVLYDHHRDASLKVIMEFLRANGILSTGRYGGWEYSSMEDAVLEGKKAAESIHAGEAVLAPA